jgi:hypothetical protein
MSEETQEGASANVDTRHEAHPHAKRRVFWSLLALGVVCVGVVVWMQWGEEIKDACLGDKGACTVDLDALSERDGTGMPNNF